MNNETIKISRHPAKRGGGYHYNFYMSKKIAEAVSGSLRRIKLVKDKNGVWFITAADKRAGGLILQEGRSAKGDVRICTTRKKEIFPVGTFIIHFDASKNNNGDKEYWFQENENYRDGEQIQGLGGATRPTIEQVDMYRCGICGAPVAPHFRYCPNCGGALKWGEMDER